MRYEGDPAAETSREERLRKADETRTWLAIHRATNDAALVERLVTLIEDFGPREAMTRLVRELRSETDDEVIERLL